MHTIYLDNSPIPLALLSHKNQGRTQRYYKNNKMVWLVDNKKAIISEKFSTAQPTTISFPIWETFNLIF